MKCPKCDFPRMKKWNELTGDEKFLIARLPPSADYTSKEREQHLFCPCCRHEETARREENC